MSVLPNKIAASSAMLRACAAESVQEGNYLSHAWQGGVFQIHARVTWTDTSVEVEYPRISPPGIPWQLIKDLKTLIKRLRRVEYMTLKGIRSGDLTLLPRQLSSTHQDGFFDCCAARGSALLDQGIRLPCCWQGSVRICLARHWQLLCPPCCLLVPLAETLGLGFGTPHWLLCYIPPRLLECGSDINVC